MAITGIEISDFQSHKFSVVKPAPAGQLTVIVGPSDSGKTAIIRALRWLFYNAPQGADFIRVGSNAAKVTVNFDDEQVVTRERSRKGFNRYKIGDDRYEGFGSAVPFEVQEITGVRPVQIGDMELCLNLSEQLDGPFLGKSVSAPAKAKVLGKLAGTEEVDFAAKGVGTDIYRARQDEKRLSDDVANLQDELKRYEYLPELAEKIAQVEGLLAVIKKKTERKLQLEKLREQLNEVVENRKNVDAKWIVLSRMILLADPILDMTGQRLKIYQGLRSASDRLRAILVELRQLQETLDATVDVNEAAGILSQALDREQRMRELRTLRGKHFLAGSYIPAQEQVIASTDGIPVAEQVAAGLIDSVSRMERLKQYSAQLQLLQEPKATSEQDVIRLAGLDLAAITHHREAENVRMLGGLLSLQFQLRAVRQRLEANRIDIERSAAEETRYCEGYKTTLLAAGVCPVCGSQVNEKTLREVM